MPTPSFSDDEIEAILTQDGAQVPDDFQLVRSDGVTTVVRVKDCEPHGYFMSDELADAMVSYLKRRGAKLTGQP